MNCEQRIKDDAPCPRPAVTIWTWVTGEKVAVCVEHKASAERLAAAMGYAAIFSDVPGARVDVFAGGPPAARPHFNGLTPEQDERLALLAEECAEVIKIVCKIQRHGLDSKNPLAETDGTNRDQLEKEIGHVRAAVLLLTLAKDIDANEIGESECEKLSSVGRWLHHAKVPGEVR